MIDTGTSKDDRTDGGEAALPVPWVRATMADIQDLDFEVPIARSIAADSTELSELFRAATKPDRNAEPADTPAARVFSMLWAITGMHFKPQDPNEPFGPMMTLADGRRTAVPLDFRGAPVDLLAQLAERAKSPVLRARLADVSWLLERKRADQGTRASAAYVEIVQKIDSGELRVRFAEEPEALKHDAVDYMRRALQIGRAIGWDKPETIAARELVIRLRKRATETRALVPMLWFAQLDLDLGVSDPADVGVGIDGVLAAPPKDANGHVVVDLWRLAARAYHYAKRDDDKHRCQSEAADRLVADAEASLARPNSALLAAHTLSAAIAQLHGIPGKKERRTELRHRLIDIQSRIPDEMSTFAHQLDLREIAEQVEKNIGRFGLTDKLFGFAVLARSPEPETLVREAIDSIREHPLSAVFSTSHLDNEGKVIHRTEGSNLSGKENDSAIRGQIAQAEAIRRQIVALGQIEAARRAIVSDHYLSKDVLASLLQHSPFVPPDCVATFSQGFLRFFQGDLVSAVYTLTPLLENALRHVLKSYGHDVTTFDDATQTQQDRTISSLFEQMRGELDDVFTKAVTTDIDNVFLTVPGPHLRHTVAHGLLSDKGAYGADAIYACWLIFRLCMLPLFPYRDELRLPFE